MSDVHSFVFEGLPVRGILVRVTDAWQEILRRRASNSEHGPYPAPVAQMLGEMVAAGALMQANIKFDGALTLHAASGRTALPPGTVAMSSTKCSHCTAAIPVDANFCAYCGTPTQ